MVPYAHDLVSFVFHSFLKMVAVPSSSLSMLMSEKSTLLPFIAS